MAILLAVCCCLAAGANSVSKSLPDSPARFQNTQRPELDHIAHGLVARDRAEAFVDDVRDSPFPPSFILINSKHSPAANLFRAYLRNGKVAFRRYEALWSAPVIPSAIVE